MAQGEARAKDTGKRPRGKPPKPPEPGVRPNDQINLTDEESRIMPAGGKSFQQAYNVQAGVTPYIAQGRQRHHPALEQRWTEPPPVAADVDPVEAMTHRLSTLEGRVIYAARKSTVEPVFGIIKSVLGFRQFHLRGLNGTSGEWPLVTMAWNLKRLFNLSQQTAPTPVAGSRPRLGTRKHPSDSLQRPANIQSLPFPALLRRIAVGIGVFDPRWALSIRQAAR